MTDYIVNYKLFDTREDLVKFFISYFTETVKSKNGGKVNIALSGGDSPRWYLPPLAEIKDIDWGKIFIYQVDERCVPFDDEQNNYKMLKEALFDNIDIPECNLFRMNGAGDPVTGAEEYGDILIEGKVDFDLMVLGMGNDGHTASIFPDSHYLYNYKNITAVNKFPSSDQNRITLTMEFINKATKKIFVVEGNDKKEVLKDIFYDKDKLKYPAARVTGDVIWAFDKNTAGFLIN